MPEGSALRFEQEQADLARELIQESGLQVITTQEILDLGWPAVAADLFGERWAEFALALREGTMTMAEILAERNRELIEEQGAIPTLPTLAEPGTEQGPGANITLPSPVQITFQSGAVTVTPTVNPWMLTEEERDQIISETLMQLELQLRAALDEQARPGVR